MSHDPEYDGQDLAQPGDAAVLPVQEDTATSLRHAGLISWIASGSLHATMIMLMGTVYFLVREDPQETPPVQFVIPPPVKTAEVRMPIERTLIDSTVELNLEPTDTVAPRSDLALPIEDPSTDDQADAPALKGRDDAVASAEMGGPGVFMMIGAGGPGAGAYSLRNQSGKKRAVSTYGGSRPSEDAVGAALRWFKRHQSPNGMWDAERYFQNCTEDPKCEPGSLENYAAEQVNVAMTGYALKAYLAAGYDHKTPSKFRPVVKKGLDYLLSVQKPDGLLGARNYEHPVATMALAEAYAMTNDPDLRGPAQKGINLILARQNRDNGVGGNAGSGGGGLGWDYQTPGKRNDSSVTGWNVMALKAGAAGGLDVGTGIISAKTWLERVWKANNDGQGGRPDWQKLDPYTSESLFSYCWSGSAGFDKEMGHQNMAPVGLLSAVFLGHASGDPMLESLANYVVKHQTPTSYPTNTYYLYYNTLGMFQVGGDKWKAWNASVRDMLVGAQRKGEGCLDGSWDFEGTAFHGHKIGRVLSTAYSTLCLEVYYIIARVQEPAGKHR